MNILTRKDWKRVTLAADRGDAQAQFERGCLCEEGAHDATGRWLVAPSAEQALRWHRVAAEQGHPQAQAAMSRLLSSGDGAMPDFPAAIAWGKKAVAQGDAAAAFNLATIYRDLGKPKTAFGWYQRAAAMGDHDAFLTVGLSYLFGWGVPQDWDAARVALNRVVDGDPVATFQRSREDAMHWLAVVDLLGGRHTPRSVAPIRARLEAANADEDHEQANALLHLIGKRRYMAQRPGRGSHETRLEPWTAQPQCGHESTRSRAGQPHEDSRARRGRKDVF
jgi:TPR repeat protein